MKRIIYIFLAFVVLIATACTRSGSDGLSSVNSGPHKDYIFFEADVMDVDETKATLLTGESLPSDNGTAFGVIGYYEDDAPIFNSYTNGIANVYRNDGVFQYDNLASWMGTQHRFHAFYPYSINGSVIVGDDNIPYIDYTQPTDEDSMVDILGAYTSITHESLSPSPVDLHFQHLLWALNVTIRNSQVSEVANSETMTNPLLTINEILFKISGIPQKAEFKLNADYELSVSSTADFSYTLSPSDAQITSGQSIIYGPLLFLPMDGLKYQISIKYTTQSGFTDTLVYPSETEYRSLDIEFDMGQAYSITIDKKNDKFFVGLAASTWDEVTVNHTFE